MRAVLIDTHTFAWGLYGDKSLSAVALREIENAESVCLSAASFYEIAQKVRLGRWPEMQPLMASLLASVQLQGIDVLSIDAAISLRAGTMGWRHRDPFDRMLAATALERALPIISADTVFDGVIGRIW